MRRFGPLLIIVALSATVIVPILLGGQAALSATLHFPIRGYLAFFALIAASWLARAFKLHLLLHRLHLRLRFAHVLGISLATDFAFLTTPGGVGGYAASVYYLRRAGASVSGAAAITAADQGMDVMFFMVALPLAGFALIWSDVPRALSTIAFGTSALIALLGLSALLARHKLTQWLFETNALSTRWPRLLRIQQWLHEFSARLRADAQRVLAGSPAFLFGLFVLTAIQQLTRYGVLWLALLWLGYRVSFLLTFLLQVFVLQAAVWTGVPAGGGGAEIGLSATLATWVPGPGLATALLLWRVATLYLCLVAGAVAVALLARRANPRVADTAIAQACAATKGAE